MPSTTTLEPVRVEAVAHRRVLAPRAAGRLDRRDHAEPLAERRLPGRERPRRLGLLRVRCAVGERAAVEAQRGLQPERREPGQVVLGRHVVGHVGLHRRVADVGQLGEGRAERAGGPVRRAPGEPVGDGVDGQARAARQCYTGSERPDGRSRGLVQREDHRQRRAGLGGADPRGAAGGDGVDEVGELAAVRGAQRRVVRVQPVLVGHLVAPRSARPCRSPGPGPRSAWRKTSSSLEMTAEPFEPKMRRLASRPG